LKESIVALPSPEPLRPRTPFFLSSKHNLDPSFNMTRGSHTEESAARIWRNKPNVSCTNFRGCDEEAHTHLLVSLARRMQQEERRSATDKMTGRKVRAPAEKVGNDVRTQIVLEDVARKQSPVIRVQQTVGLERRLREGWRCRLGWDWILIREAGNGTEAQGRGAHHV
jgi:hypothetical protein